MSTSHFECQLCGASCRPPRLHVCAGCGAMAYCSETHWRHHWKRGGHEEECVRMAHQMGRAEELSCFPFPWAAELCTLPAPHPFHTHPAATQPSRPSSPGHHHQQQQGHEDLAQGVEGGVKTSSTQRPMRPICRVLAQAGGCHAVGLWRRLCPCATEAVQASPGGEMQPGAWGLAPAAMAAGTAATARPVCTAEPPYSGALPPPQARGNRGEDLQRQCQCQDHGVDRETSPAPSTPLPAWGQLQRPVLGRVGTWLPADVSGHVLGHVSWHVSGARGAGTGTAPGAEGLRESYSKAGARPSRAAGSLADATEGAQGEQCALRRRQGAQQSEAKGQGGQGEVEGREEGEQEQQEQEEEESVVWARDVWRLPANLVPRLHPPKMRSIGPRLETASHQSPELTANSRQHDLQQASQAEAALGQEGDEREEATGCGGPGHGQQEEQEQGRHEPCEDSLYGVCDWLSYYRWCGLPLESPVALVLHFPLTLWHVLCCADRRAGGRLLGESGRRRGREGKREWERGQGEQQQGHEPEQVTGQDQQRQEQAQGAGRQGIARDSGQRVECKRRRLGAPGEEAEVEGRGGGGGQQVREQQQEYDRGKDQQHVRLQRLPDEQEGGQRQGGTHLDVLYLGPQSELDCLDAFAVLLPLLPPAATLHLHMVGPDVPPSMHGTAVRYGSAAQRYGSTGGERQGSAAGGRQQQQQPCQQQQQEEEEKEDKEQPRSANGAGEGCFGVSGGRGVLGQVGGGQGSDGSDGSGSGDGGPAAAGACGGGAGGAGAGTTPCGAGGAGLVVYLYSGVLHEQEDGVLQQLLGVGASAGRGPGLGLGLGHVRQEGGPTCAPGVRAVAEPLQAAAAAAAVAAARAAAAAGSQPGVQADQGLQAERAATWAGRPGACWLPYNVEDGQRPLVVLCPNAGLPAYPTWGPTLELLLPQSAVNTHAAKTQVQVQDRRIRRTPMAVMFTGYNEEECVRSGQMLYGMYGMELAVRQEVNPFRQPLWCYERAGNALPSYSNGFVYGWYDGV